MSRYEVKFTGNAVNDFQLISTWYAAKSIVAEAKWIAAVEKALDLLERNPLQFARVLDADLQSLHLQQFNLGVGRRLTHRMVFAIRPKKVVVYAIRHLSQAELTADDI